MKKRIKAIVSLAAVTVSIICIAGCSAFDIDKTGSLTTTEKTVGTYSGSVLDQDVLDKLETLETYVNKYYYYDVDDDWAEGIYEGLMEALDDPYAKYYTAEEYAELAESNSGEYAGIGVVVRQDTDTGYPVAVSIVEDSPAASVDIQAGDYIVQIDDYEIESSDDLDYLVSMIRGDEGTDVTLKIYRPDDMKYHEVTITRQIVENKTVSYTMMDDNIGYIVISQFVSNTDEQFEEAVDDLESQGMQALLIDVRDNPGGILDTVVNVCDYILSEGLIVYDEDKEGNIVSSYEATDEHSIDIPMAILVNGESASASEILTGALKDHGVATVIGETTYGKGIVQSLISLGDGSAIKLTTSKYYTPNGNDIHEVGIEPDIEVSLPDDYTTDDYLGENDTQYQKGIEVLKEALEQ